MGGVLIVIAILLPTLAVVRSSNKFVWLVMASTLGFAAIGFADDYIKVIKRRNLGLTARAKLFWQTVVSELGVALALVAMQQFGLFLHAYQRALRQGFSSGIELALAGLCRALWPARLSAVHYLCHSGDQLFFECSEPDRRPGWPGDRLHDHRGRRADGAHLCKRPCGLCRLS
jgi:hypothetical protein